MKQFVTFILIITIQVTFLQKVVASVVSIESASSSIHCEMETMEMGSVYYSTGIIAMNNCQTDCDMMSVVSVTHFIDDTSILLFPYTQLSYPTFNSSTITPQPKGLYRPPLYS